MKINQLVFALMLCCATSAIALPKHAPVPGGIAVIDLGPVSQTVPTARWGEQPIASFLVAATAGVADSSSTFRS